MQIWLNGCNGASAERVATPACEPITSKFRRLGTSILLLQQLNPSRTKFLGSCDTRRTLVLQTRAKIWLLTAGRVAFGLSAAPVDWWCTGLSLCRVGNALRKRFARAVSSWSRPPEFGRCTMVDSHVHVLWGESRGDCSSPPSRPCSRSTSKLEGGVSCDGCYNCICLTAWSRTL